jgi:hypothetical protein
MNRFLIGLLIGLLLGTTLTTQADIIGAGWRSKDDGYKTYEPALPAGFNSAISSVNSLTGAEAVATLVYVRPTGTGQPCEGRPAIITARGLECVVTEAP